MRGLKPLPVVGARLDILRFFMDPINMMRRIHDACGQIGSVTAGSTALVLAVGPELNQQILTAPRRYHNADPPFDIAEDSSLMTLKRALTGLNGEAHRRMRRLMMPAFSRQAVARYRDDVVSIAEQHLARWRPGQVRDMVDEMMQLTLSVMMKSIFGLDSSSDEFVLGSRMLSLLDALVSPAVVAFPYDLPGTPFGRMSRLSDEICGRIKVIIDRRREDANQDANEDANQDPSGDRSGQDVLSLLIDARDDDGVAMDDDGLIAQAAMLFSAGHETTASTLAWTLFLLAQHPGVYRDLVDELDGALHGQAPTIEQLGSLPLLDAVVKETMRLMPAVPALFLRRAVGDGQLCGYPVVAGSHIVLSPFLTHRLPELYPDGDAFSPQRWQSLKPSSFEYMPFGAGPRLCLGAAFAAQEIRLVLALLLQRFRMSLLPGDAVDYAMHAAIMTPKRLRMRIDAQDGAFAPRCAIGGNVGELVRLPV